MRLFLAALKGLTRTPLFTITAVVSLALGIGVNTAMFSILDRVMLRTLPVDDPHELVFLYNPGPVQGRYSADEAGNPSFSYPMFRELQAQQTPFVDLAGARMQQVSLAYNNQASTGNAHLVSGNYFSLLGVDAAFGRLLTERDDQTLGGNPVAVLSHGYWTARFGGDVAALNETVVVNGYPLTIVGVTQRGFQSDRLGATPDLFVPITMKQELTPDWDGFQERRNYWIPLFGRLAPGASVEQAEAAINVIYKALLEQDVAVLRNASDDFIRRFRAKTVFLRPGQHGRGGLHGQAQQPLFLLMGMTLLVLLIACANVANLQLTRALARTREVAVRLALGASRAQLLRHLLAESCVLAVAGGALGLLLAHWTVRGIVASAPSDAGNVMTATLDGRVLLFALGLSFVTGIVFGLYPALQVSNPRIAASLREQSGQSTSTRAAGVFRKSLVTVQTAVSVLLLVSAGLFAKTLVNLNRVDLGIRTDHLVSFSVAPKLNRYTDERVALFYAELADRLLAIPGVDLVSAAEVPAISGNVLRTSITVEGFTPADDERTSAHTNGIGPGYFRTLGIPLLAGREFTRTDDAVAPKVAVVNEAFARRFFDGANPLGRRLDRGGSADGLDTTIVGVVQDAKYSDVSESPPSVFYLPYRQRLRGNPLSFYVRTAIEPEQMIPLVRRAVAELDPGLPLRDLQTMEAQVASTLGLERLLSVLSGSFAGLAALLAGIGLYGVLAYNVARRTPEIGVRIALGASVGHVRALVARDGVVMIGIGVVTGLAAAAAAARLVQPILYELTPWDPLVYGSATIVLGLIATIAAYLPARRAAGVDPVVALRAE